MRRLVQNHLPDLEAILELLKLALGLAIKLTWLLLNGSIDQVKKLKPMYLNLKNPKLAS